MDERAPRQPDHPSLKERQMADDNAPASNSALKVETRTADQDWIIVNDRGDDDLHDDYASLMHPIDGPYADTPFRVL